MERKHDEGKDNPEASEETRDEQEEPIGEVIIPDDPYCPTGMVSVRDDLDEP